MDRDQLAFAGVARQAELIRAGEVSSRELVILYLERIERIDPQLNAFRKVMDERRSWTLSRPTGAGARVTSGAARRADRGDGRRGRDREVTAGTAANSTPASQDSEIVRGCACGRGRTRQDQHARGAILGDTEGPAFGITRNPWNTTAARVASSGGQRGRRGGRPVRGGHRLG